MPRLLLCLLCLFVGLAAQAASPGSPWQLDEAARSRLGASLDSRWSRLFPQGQLRVGATSMEAAAFAVDAVATGYDGRRITAALRAVATMHDRDPASRTYGNMHWYMGDTKLVDRNGIQFAMRRLVLIPLLFPDRLETAQRALLDEVLTLAKIGLVRHAVSISYTNIFLMKTWNLIALGEATGDEAVAAQGRGMLRDWLAHTARTGISEYLSPTYFEVDLDNLSLIANLSRDAATRAMARDGLKYFWHDIALHWFLPGERLGGVHSRDYDRLFNMAALNAKMIRTGWTTVAPRAPPAGPYEHHAWTAPPEDARRWLDGPFPRFISERWGAEPEKRLAHYMGRNFGISSAESGYSAGHDNAPLVINMGSGADVPIIDFFMDGRRDRYGMNKTLEAGSGHMKALHLKPFLASAQRDNEVLFLAAIRNDTTNNVAVESIVTLPADAEIRIDDRPLELFGARSAWHWDTAPNGDSTRIDVRERDGRTEVLLGDQDDRLGVGIARRFAVQPGESYRLSASLLGGDVFLYLNFLDAEGRLVDGERALRVRGGDGAFVSRAHSAVAPPGAVQCKAWLYSTSGNRTHLRIDDLRFEHVPAGGGSARLLGGFDFREFRAGEAVLPAGATLFLRRQDVAVALRILGAWGVDGRAIEARIHNDGLAYGAMRLTAVHADGPAAGQAAIAMWARAEEGVDGEAAFAAFRARLMAAKGEARREDDILDAVMQSPVGRLRLRADIAKGHRLSREGMTPVPPDAVLWVDGRDLAPELLGAYR